MFRNLAVLSLLALLGCGYVAQKNYDVSTESVVEMCQRVTLGDSFRQSAERRRILTRKNLLTYADWTLVEQKKLSVGMSECAVIAILGFPRKSSREPYRIGEINSLVFYKVKRKSTKNPSKREFDLLPDIVISVEEGRLIDCRRILPSGGTEDCDNRV